MTLRPFRERAETEAEARAARLFGALAAAPRAEPPSLSAIERKVAEAHRARRAATRVVALALAGAAAAAATWQLAAPRPRPAPPPPVRDGQGSAREAPRRPGAEPLDVSAPWDSGGSPAPTRGAPPERGERGLALSGARGVVRPDAGSPAPPPVAAVETGAGAAAESTLGEEARLLAEALSAIRQDRDAARALEVLGRYRARFPQGVLRLESLLAEAEAERLLGDPERALAVLDSATPDEVAQGAVELGVLRGELWAEQGACPKAEAAFAAALRAGAGGPLAERAEFGRARCAALRDGAEAEALLRGYRARWPDGHFTAAAKDLLESLAEGKVHGP